jgi:hypothetical protein
MSGHIVATLVLVPHDDQAVRVWLMHQGFAAGDLRGTEFKRPMAWACFKGELNVCKWLYNHGAAADITKVDNWGRTPMSMACERGHLDGCKWLYEKGATAYITKADNNGFTPMYVACWCGHLDVCKWLYEKGAAADITKADNNGFTPMYVACWGGHLDVCKWLAFNGARPGPNMPHHPALLDWAQHVTTTHRTFFHVVLRGSVVMPRRRISPRRRCHLPRLPRGVLQLLGLFLDVEVGRRLRNVREFTASFAL